jgi:hypothetical protein
MSCKRGFLRSHLVAIFPKTFIENEYKKHREMILYEREKCMLPQTQIEMELDAEKKLVNDSIVTNHKNRWTLYEKIYNLKYSTIINNNPYQRRVLRRALTPEDKAEILKNEDEIKTINILLTNLRIQKNRLAWAHLSGEKPEERRQFIKNCPVEGCKGFLSTQWKCGLCEAKVCNKCHEIKSTKDDNEDKVKEHVCDEEAVKTVETINKDTKPCPSCGTRIHKISGCSQMWCPQCHIAFDWNSLRIATGVIHNPHFYEYQRSQNGGVAPRVPGDIPGCEIIPNLYRCIHIWNDVEINIPKSNVKKLSDMHRMLIHIQNYEITRIPNNYIAAANNDIRKQFLRNEIDEKRLMWFLQKREKGKSKGREIRQLYEMLIACGTDFIRRSIDTNRDKEILINDIESVITEFVNLAKYFNENSHKISDMYGGVIPTIRFLKAGSWCSLFSTYKDESICLNPDLTL